MWLPLLSLVLVSQYMLAAPAEANNWGALDSSRRCTEDPDRLSQCTAPDANDHRILLVFLDTAALVTATQAA
jgi:hypothetical protein